MRTLIAVVVSRDDGNGNGNVEHQIIAQFMSKLLYFDLLLTKAHSNPPNQVHRVDVDDCLTAPIYTLS